MSISTSQSHPSAAPGDPSDIVITLPDGSQRTVTRGITIRQVAESIGKRLGKDAIGGVVDNAQIIDVHTPLTRDCALRIVTVHTPDGLEVLRHSTAHVMATAVQYLFPGTQVTIGPSIEAGFYYDFKRDGGFTPEDLAVIEKEMHKLAAKDVPFVREEVSRDVAQRLFADLGETFKLELIDAIPAGDSISIYRLGDWFDLCRGPHVPSSGFIKAFKLTHVAGAYWRGDERNPMLSRIYGTAFWNAKDLDKHFALIEEAKKRDHRRIGKELDLFSFHPLAPAMPFFHPAGTVIYNQLLQYVRNYYRAIGFDEVITPQLFDVDLFKQSGHYGNYAENMFFCDIDEREFGLKPMNCPGHALMYAHQLRSYRELPIRYADFGRLHRNERSGVTAGLTRVRSFCQDDAHIFCREDQIGSEIETQVIMLREIYGEFGFEVRIGLSTRPEKSLGSEETRPASERAEWDAVWGRAEDSLRKSLDATGVTFHINAGDGAFYGPKIDYEVQDALGRWHQLGTIQLDFGQPRQFDLRYVNAESATDRPVMIHRAILGSLERFVGILTEHCAGDFPMWLAPHQVRVISINDDVADYANQVAQSFDAHGLRVKIDGRSEKLGFKIRDAEMHKIPVVVVVGAQEKETQTVSLRYRKKGDQGKLPLDQAVQTVLDAAAMPQPGKNLLAKAERKLGLT